MKSIIPRAATLVAIAALSAAPALAETSVEQAKQQHEKEAKSQGSHMIQVEERAVWGLGELPPDLMTQAFVKLASDPHQAELGVMQSADILQLQAASMPDLSESKALKQAADELRGVARKMEYRQVLTPDQLRQPFAKAALAAAAFYQVEAKRGLEMNDEEKTGYSLKGAAQYLAAAHAFAGREPTPEVSRAAYDGNLLGEQIINASKPLAGAKGEDAARTAGAEMKGQDNGSQSPDDKANLPQPTKQVVADLGQAISAAQKAVDSGKASE